MRRDSGCSRTSLVLVVAAAASLTGCLPIQSTPHTCPCVCYKEKGNNVWISQAPTSTTYVNCGDLNGTACTGGAGGTATFDGTLQHCGPYTNVSLDPLHHFLNYNPTAVQEKSQ
jgi:hypothetical protein